jgi:P-type Cu2+ transporter
MTVEACCFHCRETLGAGAIDSQLSGICRSFCCAGCASAAQWIEQEGLGAYYQLRSRQSDRIDASIRDYSAWDSDEITQKHCQPCTEGLQITLLTDGMHCAACAWLIQNALQKEAGVAVVNANAITGRVELRWNPDATRLSTLCTRLAKLGYRPYLAVNEAYELENRRQRRRLLLKLGLAALVTTQTMMFSEALYLDTAREMPLATRDFFRWLTFLLCTPVVFYSGSEFIRGMLREWHFRQAGMDTLAASSILLAYFASLYQTLVGGDHVWFDASAMFVFFLLAARMLERFARQSARAQLDVLARAQPALAWRVQNGQRLQCPASMIQTGDVLFLPPGETVPADGELRTECVDVDEALLTGESKLQTKRCGDTVLAGSLLGPVAGEIKVTRIGADTQLSQIRRLLERAQNARPAQKIWAQRLASHFVLAMFAITVAAFAYWWQTEPSKAFSVALAVLVAACPCALSLAVPAAVSSSIDALARAGVLVVNPEALNRLDSITDAVFDKTGTLTQGRSCLQHVHVFSGCTESQALQWAYSLEQGSKHPLAAAFSAFKGQPIAFDELRVMPGQGISGSIGTAEYRIGRAEFAAPGHSDLGIWLSCDGTAWAQFHLHDPIKPGARDQLAWLSANGISGHLLSGDSSQAVQEAGQVLNITAIRARAMPEDKLAYLQQLQSQGRSVLMVGDGINDAPVLAKADVSMAMGSGAWLAQSTADIILMNSSLKQIRQVFGTARQMRKLMRQNLQWAIAYNVVAVGIALSGIIHPGYAALGMAGSSLLVTLNALRIYKVK